MSSEPRINGASDETTLSVANLSFAYGSRFALRNINLVLAAGQCTVLLGMNGAGKSTLFALLTHLFASRKGTILIKGFDLKNQTNRALSQLGVVFQQPTLDLDLSVHDNLIYHCRLHGLSDRLANQRIDQELERQGLNERSKDRVRTLSGGLRRRVEVARALLHKPSLLLLDEPTTGLDLPSRKALVAYVHDLTRSQQLSVLWATHLIDEVFDEDQVAIIHQGELRAQGFVADILETAKARTIDEAFSALTTDKLPAA